MFAEQLCSLAKMTKDDREFTIKLIKKYPNISYSKAIKYVNSNGKGSSLEETYNEPCS